MSSGATTVGPLSTDLRDRIAEYRDANDHQSYHEALEAMLNEVSAE